MKIVGRNELCSCGSMRKFKHCHGSLTDASAGTDVSITTTFAHEIRKIREKNSSHRSAYGDIKEIITAEANGFRFVASGKKLVFSRVWKVFPDFLNQHLHSLIGKEWGEREVQLPYEKQHPIIQWRTSNALAIMNAFPDEDGLHGADTGAANA